MDHWVVGNCLWERTGSGGIPREDAFWTVPPTEIEGQRSSVSGKAEWGKFMHLIWTQTWADDNRYAHPFALWFTKARLQDDYLSQQHGSYSYIVYEKIL